MPLFAHDPDLPFLRSYSGEAGGCLAVTHCMGFRPNGDAGLCPGLPLIFRDNRGQDRSRDLRESAELAA